MDVGAARLHCVLLAGGGQVADVCVLDPGDDEGVRRMLVKAALAAVDAPAALSRAPHAGDAALSPKFRLARCAEVALGREHGIWVPWVTPDDCERAPRWMQVGLDLFALARAAGCPVIEVFPHAGFRRLAQGAPLPRKSMRAGTERRAELLRFAGVQADGLETWSHDALDACLAALVAARSARGEATAVTCSHDDSAIWLR